MQALPCNSRFEICQDKVDSTSVFLPRLRGLNGYLCVILFLLAIFLSPPSGVLAQDDFLRNLPDKGVATIEDGCRIMAAFLKISPSDPSFEKLAKELIERKIIRERWAEKPDAPLTWGKISYMLCRALKIRGGLIMTIIGTNERYAYRECIDKKLMPGDNVTLRGNKARFLTGLDLMAILHRAEVYQREH